MFGTVRDNNLSLPIMKMGDIVEIRNGRDYKTIQNDNGKYPVYGTGGIITHADDYLCPENTVIIGRKGTINNPILVKEKFWNVDTAFGIICDQNVLNPIYYFWFCKQYDFTQHNKATTIPSLVKADLQKISVIVPDKERQDEFASFVKQVDKSKVIFSTTLKSRFIEMFGHQDQNEKEFRISTIGESCIIRDSERIPITSTYRESGPYPYYGANGLQDYVKDYIFDGEFVLVAEDGGYFDDPDRPIAYSVSGKCWVNNHAHILQPGKEINVQYLEWALKYRDVTNVINGTTRSKLTQAAMRSITILLPPKELQDSFSQFLIQVDKSKFKLKNTVKSLTIKIKQISSEDKAHSAHIFNIVY